MEYERNKNELTFKPNLAESKKRVSKGISSTSNNQRPSTPPKTARVNKLTLEKPG